MRLLLCVFAFLFADSLNAAEKHDHRERGAHVHGSASLAIAFDGAQGKIEFKAPSESLFGFEHAATSDADKKTMEDALLKFETQINDMIGFSKELNCQFHKDKLEVIFEGKNHSDTSAAFTVKCAKSPVGSQIQFNIQKHFPKLKDIDAQIIADNVQKSAEIKKADTNVELK